MKWITRERPKIDRIACPWLIKNFVDKEAEFIYVPKNEVFEKAREFCAIPYDIPGAEYSHYHEKCTFDFIVTKHELTDPVLQQLAEIRAAHAGIKEAQSCAQDNRCYHEQKEYP